MCVIAPLQALILTGVLLLSGGIVMTNREFNMITAAGLPLTGIPNCTVNPSTYYE